jgi:hypothetical protein
MSLRPGRPAVPVRQCMYEKCRSTRATPVNIDGKHPRDLCDDHATGLRDIWTNRRQAYKVSWGLSSDEKRTKDEALLSLLLATYGEPNWQARPEPDYNSEEWLNSLDDDDDAPYVQTTEEQAWEEVERLRWTIQDIQDSAYRAPTVRVRVHTGG